MTKRTLAFFAVVVLALGSLGNRVVNRGAGGGSSLGTDLVAGWHMDEAANTTRVDFVGSNDLADNGTVFGVGSVAGALNNAGEYVTVNQERLFHADDTALRFGSAFTLSVWVKFTSFPGADQHIVSKYGGSDPNNEFILEYHLASDRIRCRIWDQSGNVVSVSDTNLGAPSTATWYNIVVKLDSGTLSIRTNDGTPVTADASGQGTRGGNGNFVVGSFSGNPALFAVDGLIDELLLYNVAKSDADITLLYGGGTPPTVTFP